MDNERGASFEAALQQHLEASLSRPKPKLNLGSAVAVVAVKPETPAESILCSQLHSHSFVRLESNYTPISHDDDRQKYLSVPCLKGVDDVREFY